MTNKKQPSKPIADIAKPRRSAVGGPASPQLVIPKRPIIVPVSDADSANEPSEPIAPRHVGKNLQPETMPTAGAEPPTEAKAPKPAAAEQPAEPTKTEPPETTADPSKTEASEPEKSAEASADTTQQSAEPAADVSTDETADGTQAKATPHPHKSPEDVKREKEIQGYIENRDFFVPINAVARKRSLRVSIVLTICELVLGLILLNLMLDAGLIQLIEKIPHTNFFNVN